MTPDLSFEAEYFKNHERRSKFPWSLYHQDLTRRVARAILGQGEQPQVLIVGCGLEPFIEGGPPQAKYWGCDLDPRAVAACARLYPELSTRLASCENAYTLPSGDSFPATFDVVIAKEVVEHLDDPARWARVLSARVKVGGELVLTTPNYGRFSTLGIIERTVLEWVARRDGYSRAHIHPSKFDAKRLRQLDVGADMQVLSVERSYTNWALVGRWLRA